MISDRNIEIAKKKQIIEQKLEQTGKRKEFEDYLRQKLIESGWRDEIKKMCIELIQSKGIEKIKLDELIDDLVPKGKALVPQTIREEMLARIQDFIETQNK